MLYVAIVGHESAKFDAITEPKARALICDLLLTSMEEDEITVVSGRCPLGGIDVWAEEAAKDALLKTRIFPPATSSWETGFKPRNIQIAEQCDIIHNIVVRELPANYRGRRFPHCYHCHTTSHVKSGGCWTAKYAEGLGKPAMWHEL